MSIVFSELALKYGPWSISKSNLAAQCTQKYYWKYLHKPKLKEPRVQDPRGRIGSAAHLLVELLLKGYEKNLAYKKAIVDNRLTTPEADLFLEYRENVDRFLDKLASYKEKYPVTDVIAEKRFGLTKDFKPTKFFSKNVFFRGVWDLVIKIEKENEKPVVVIMDHKTGDAPNDEEKSNKYDDQLQSYLVGAIYTFPEIKGAQIALNYLKDDTVHWKPYMPREQIEDEIVPHFIELINKNAENLRPILEGEDPVPTKGWHCTFCGFKSNCPLWDSE